MVIIEIKALENGAHRNQSGEFATIPDGWAVVRCSTPNFPFGTPAVAKINGVMTVTAWKAGTLLETETVETEQTESEVLAATLADHEYRLTQLEAIGLTD